MWKIKKETTKKLNSPPIKLKLKRLMFLIWVLIAFMFCGEKLRNNEKRERERGISYSGFSL